MMRSPHAWGIAVRKPSGEIVTHSEPLERPSEQHKWMGWPVVRGVMTLGHAMSLGFRALKFSANAALEEISPDPGNDDHSNDDHGDKDPAKKLEIPGWMVGVNIAFSVAFFIFMYKYLPLLATTELKKVNPVFGQQIVFNLVDGLIRIAMFLLFVWGVSLWKDIRRVYEYHGAEHKTVFAFEHGDPLETAAVIRKVRQGGQRGNLAKPVDVIAVPDLVESLDQRRVSNTIANAQIAERISFRERA